MIPKLIKAATAATATLAILSINIAICANKSTIPTEGLVSHWSFDNDKKDIVVDSQNSYNGVATNVNYERGVKGKAAAFDGESSKIIIEGDGNLPPSEIAKLQQGTVSFWIKFENRGGQVLPILYLGKSTLSMPSHGLIFEIGHDRGDIANRRLYFTGVYSTSANFCVDSGMNLQTGVWYNYTTVMGKDGSTLYINGVEITTRRYNLGATPSSNSFFNNVSNKEMLSIGYGRYSQEEPFYSFNGLIDEVMIYDRPLSSDEVLQLFDVAGLKMGDEELGYIDAQSMVGKEPLVRGGAQKSRSRTTNNNSNRAAGTRAWNRTSN